MAKCLTCDGSFSCPVCEPNRPLVPSNSDVAKVAEPCPEKCTATVFVRDSKSNKGIDGIKVTLAGEVLTDANGFVQVANLSPGKHQVTLSLVGVENRYILPAPGRDKMEKTINAGGRSFYIFELDPLTSLEVTVARSDRDGMGIKQAEVVLTPDGGAPQTKTTTTEDGKVLFEGLRASKATLKVTLKDDSKKRFHVEEAYTEQAKVSPDVATRDVLIDLSKTKNETKLVCTPQIYLKLQYQDPEDAVWSFPKDFAVAAVFTPGDTELIVKVLDDEGNLQFPAPKDKTHFTLKFDAAQLRLLTHEDQATESKVLEAPTEENMRKVTADKTQFFALPNKWSLVNATWAMVNISVPADGNVAIPAEGVGKEGAPAELKLQPKVQFARLLFHDRKYGRTDHGKRPVCIPPVVLKAARRSDASGAPDAPIAGTHDSISNWIVNRGDNSTACQALPWVVTKDDLGAELPKLTNDMVLEFGWADGFVVSKGPGAADRVIETIAATDTRRTPNKDRNKYYDLPQRWLSKCYYTRLHGGDIDPTKNRFFDELTDGEIETSFSLATPLRFSLDDVVLVGSTGDQALQDWNRTAATAALPLSEYSRFALLHFDGDDRHKIKVHDPRPLAVYFSNTLFAKDLANRFRNVLVSYPYNLRAVVFCNGFHDVYDKRSTTGDFSTRYVQGAREARIDDAAVSLIHRFDQPSDVTKAYMHKVRGFDMHYLHYGESDGTTVYGGVVTHWTAFIFSNTPKPAGFPASVAATATATAKFRLSGDPVDARNYREIALEKAMVRWNEKDYQFEEADDKTDVVVKHFCLFEAKEVEAPPGTFRPGGGVPHSLLGVGPDGSSATDTWMYMRKAAYQEEPDWPADVRKADIHSITHDRLVIAHELGHAAIGLWDDYITQKWQALVPGYNQSAPQRYLGIPYFRDDQSMMNPNRSPRLRMYWGRANWLNDMSAGGGSLNQFLQGKRFKATWDSPAGKLNYLHEESTRDIYKPAHQAANHSFGEQGAASLYLYKLGDDEFARQTKGGPYKGILVIEMRLCARFRTGLSPEVPHWATTQPYMVGNCVEHEAKFYLCTEPHLSSRDNKPPNAKWFAIDPEMTDTTPPIAWMASANLAKDAWVTVGGNLHVCRRTHVAGSRINAHFQQLPSSAAWAPKAQYLDSQAVTQVGRLYRCTKAHKSGNSFDPSNWSDIGPVRGVYTPSTAYQAGDVSTFGGSDYVCANAHTAGSLAADIADGRIIECGRSIQAWTLDLKKRWIAAANTAIVAMLEDGGTGKFKLTAARGDYSPVYLRMFAQWADKASATAVDPPTTQFSLDVVRGGGASCLHSVGTSISVGDETDRKTLIRYLFGTLSADATVRAGQDLTSDLTVADLSSLARWMNDREPGSGFTVQVIL